MRLRVVVPHFFREDIVGSNGGYGSGRLGNQLPRSLLGRCLGSIYLNRSLVDGFLTLLKTILNQHRHPQRVFYGIEVELHVFVTGSDWLQDILEAMSLDFIFIVKIWKIHVSFP